mgnify:CR=1 FL=1|tara:strand:- start:1129 stop:2055 length:927 start_codon:yes stop_codon:yes gene_type:complete
MLRPQNTVLVDILRNPEKRKKIDQCNRLYERESPEEFTPYHLQERAIDHMKFILMVFMRFADTFKDSIDKYLFVDILRFLPTGSFLHFKDETIRYLSAERILFDFSTFKNTTFDSCHLCHSLFRNASIEDCKFHLCCIEEGDFSDSDISNTTFHKVNLTLTMFSSAILANVNFNQVFMEKINFNSYKVNQDRNTVLKGCKFEKCEMTEAWFTKNIELDNNEFTLSNLCYAKFAQGVYHQSNYMKGCGARGIEIPDEEYFNPCQVSEIDWVDDVREKMWDFEWEAHLPYSPFCHDNIPDDRNEASWFYY